MRISLLRIFKTFPDIYSLCVFELTPSLLQFLGQTLPKNCCNEEINPKNALAKYLPNAIFGFCDFYSEPMGVFFPS